MSSTEIRKMFGNINSSTFYYVMNRTLHIKTKTISESIKENI